MVVHKCYIHMYSTFSKTQSVGFYRAACKAAVSCYQRFPPQPIVIELLPTRLSAPLEAERELLDILTKTQRDLLGADINISFAMGGRPSQGDLCTDRKHDFNK